MEDDGMNMGLTMGMEAPLFLATWVVMMVAMMFPTAAPMVLLFNRVHSQRRERGRAFVPTWVFVAGYLVVWSAFGVVAYAGALLGEEAAGRWMWLMDNAARLGGAVLIAAGLYQLSPLKDMCLTKCRMPLTFIMTSWREGYGGALRMGLEHGKYCLGCCWLLFVILFPLGIMNVAAMALVTVLIFMEKAWRFGTQARFAASAVLIGLGALVLANPDLLPTVL
ncbi:MAG: DUF2182 domain-containing protein [Dehalococcoidia bacterium]|nr:DUF2182 domain-containing protein [Dehalococcoidia bacterium]